MHRRVNILQYVKTPAGKWQWEPIPKNRRTGNYVWSKVKGDNFYVVWREHKKRRYEKAGSTPAAALEAKRRKEFELAGRAALGQGKSAPKPQANGFTVEAAVADFLEFLKNKKRPNTLKRYRAVMNHFTAFSKQQSLVSAIQPADIDAFRDERLNQDGPRGKKITPRNVNYEVAVIRTFYYYLKKFRDPSIANPAAGLKPLATTRPIVDSYEEDELQDFFEACNLEERAIFKTFYFTGLREQELAHLHWTDINLKKGILSITAKPEQGFVPKNWEEREIPFTRISPSYSRSFPSGTTSCSPLSEATRTGISCECSIASLSGRNYLAAGTSTNSARRSRPVPWRRAPTSVRCRRC